LKVDPPAQKSGDVPPNNTATADCPGGVDASKFSLLEVDLGMGRSLSSKTQPEAQWICSFWQHKMVQGGKYLPPAPNWRSASV